LQKKYPSNWELSAARASSVVRYFQEKHGMDPLRMEAVGLSKYRPVTENTDESARQRNRRVEVILTARDD
jgi:chemotaxis protein MotB